MSRWSDPTDYLTPEEEAALEADALDEWIWHWWADTDSDEYLEELDRTALEIEARA